MKLTTFGLLLLSLAAFVLCEKNAGQEIIQLTDGNFDSIVGTSDEWLVEFYAPWCGACKQFGPRYEAVARTLPGNLAVKLAKVDVDSSPGLASKFFVTRLPTLFHIKDHQVRQVDTKLNVQDILTFLKDKKWEDIPVWNGYFSPFSIVGTGVGYIGIFMKKLSSFPPWAVYTGLAVTILLIVVSFGFAASQGMGSEDDEDTSRSDGAKTPSSPRTRKSRKVD
ncbi:hypothetical protein INT44_003986 [Umbelopsis vinacea]|uniref:Thioredoxin domain-containing protein n=1 Tax=Umbelopsis vinacea TaxID=44442 RepID=A0A8H7QAK2_9FUNG|nr:hypothetical protein INT44_003986 [Umbelopsis vinacea]KAI9286921.1 thioredoxin-like protein [Umbelopsis sp. AD052]